MDEFFKLYLLLFVSFVDKIITENYFCTIICILQKIMKMTHTTWFFIICSQRYWFLIEYLFKILNNPPRSASNRFFHTSTIVYSFTRYVKEWYTKLQFNAINSPNHVTHVVRNQKKISLLLQHSRRDNGNNCWKNLPK